MHFTCGQITLAIEKILSLKLLEMKEVDTKNKWSQGSLYNIHIEMLR